MLVVERKCHQENVIEDIGGDMQRLTVTVLEIDGSRVKLGFEVADDVSVMHSKALPNIIRSANRTAPGLVANSR